MIKPHPLARSQPANSRLVDVSRKPLRRAGPGAQEPQGYLHKSTATRQLIDAIEAVLAGKIYVSGDLTEQLLGRMVSGRPPERPPVETLSPRELEVFELMGQGLTTAAIAERMHVSAKTLETYRARIKQKLNLDNINALIQRATPLGDRAAALKTKRFHREDAKNAKKRGIHHEGTKGTKNFLPRLRRDHSPLLSRSLSSSSRLRGAILFVVFVFHSSSSCSSCLRGGNSLLRVSAFVSSSSSRSSHLRGAMIERKRH